MKIIYRPYLTLFARDLRNRSTKSERMLWEKLKGNQVGYDFHRQKPIGYYIADFYCHALRLVIELDGITHHDLEVQKKDFKKTKYLEGLGITVMRFRDEEVHEDVEKVLQTIKVFIKEFVKVQPATTDTPPVSPS